MNRFSSLGLRVVRDNQIIASRSVVQRASRHRGTFHTRLPPFADRRSVRPVSGNERSRHRENRTNRRGFRVTRRQIFPDPERSATKREPAMRREIFFHGDGFRILNVWSRRRRKFERNSGRFGRLILAGYFERRHAAELFRLFHSNSAKQTKSLRLGWGRGRRSRF